MYMPINKDLLSQLYYAYPTKDPKLNSLHLYGQGKSPEEAVISLKIRMNQVLNKKKVESE